MNNNNNNSDGNELATREKAEIVVQQALASLAQDGLVIEVGDTLINDRGEVYVVHGFGVRDHDKAPIIHTKRGRNGWNCDIEFDDVSISIFNTRYRKLYAPIDMVFNDAITELSIVDETTNADADADEAVDNNTTDLMLSAGYEFVEATRLRIMAMRNRIEVMRWAMEAQNETSTTTAR